MSKIEWMARKSGDLCNWIGGRLWYMGIDQNSLRYRAAIQFWAWSYRIQDYYDGVEHNEFPETRPIWEVIDEIMADVPEEELAKLPTDGASEHDYYIYGGSKKKDKEDEK